MTVLDLDEVAPAPPHPRRRGWLVALTGLLTIALVIAGTAMWQRRQVEEPLLTPDWEAPPSEVVWTMSPTASATDDDMFTYLMPVSPDHALVFYSGLTAWAALPTDTALALLDLRTGQRLWERALDGRQSYPLAARPGKYIVEIVVSTSPSGSAAVRTTDWTTGAELSRLDDVDPASFQGLGGRILPPDVDTLALSHDDRVGLHRVLELDDPVWEADDASRVLAVTDDIVVTARASQSPVRHGRGRRRQHRDRTVAREPAAPPRPDHRSPPARLGTHPPAGGRLGPGAAPHRPLHDHGPGRRLPA